MQDLLIDHNEKEYVKRFKKVLDTYAPVTSDSFDKLWSAGNLRTAKKGEYLLHINDIAQKVYFVCEGLLISQYIKDDGSVHIKNFFTPGKLAGSKVSMLRQTPSDFAILASEDSTIWQINFRQYRQLIFEHDDLKQFYIHYLEQEWVVRNEKRQIAFATQTAMERYQTFLEEYPLLDKQVPQHQIASYLGITPTQLSRLRKKLKI